MSIESWKEEFYPVSARECAPDEEIEHSLKKWKGLLIENVNKHGLVYSFGDLKEVESPVIFPIDNTTCALCVKYHTRYDEEEEESCKECPIVIATGVVCYDAASPYRGSTPWFEWIGNHNPKPMIKMLEDTLEYHKIHKG